MPRVSLQAILLVAFVVQIAGTSALVGWLSIRNSRQAIATMANQLHADKGDQVMHYLQDFMQKPRLIDSLNREAMEMDFLNPQRAHQAGQFFLKQQQSFGVSYVNIGKPNGDYVGAGYEPDGTVAYSLVSSKDPKRGRFYRFDPQTQRAKLIDVRNYDHLSESWYTRAVELRRPVWSDIYSWSDAPQMIAISSGYPIYDLKKRLIGVFGVDLLLSDISKFLQKQPNLAGTTFIVERSGLLVASSAPSPTYTIENQQAKRLKAESSLDRLTQLTAKELIAKFGSFQHLTQQDNLSIEIDNALHYVQVLPFRDDQGLDWIIVSVIPESEFTKRINENIRVTVLLCGAAVAVAIALFLAHGLTAPILRLSQAAQAIAAGKFEQSVRVRLPIPFKVKELEALAFSFNQMAQRLQTSFMQLEQSNERLEQRVEERTAQLRLKNSIAAQIRNSLDLETILQTAATEIREYLQIDRCILARFDSDTATWNSITEAKTEFIKSVLGACSQKSVGWIGERILACQIVQIDQVRALGDPVVNRLAKRLGIESFLGFPILSRQGVFGIIICGHAQIHSWQAQEIGFLESVTDQLAIAISQAELYAEARMNAKEAQWQAEQLVTTIKDLQRTQAQLIQTEKMSSLGQMVAGIAHEINNPVNFIYGNLNHAEQYFKDVLQLLNLYQQQYPNPPEAIQTEADKIDIDFVTEDAAKIFQSMEVGAERIRDIVRSLRNFARLDEAEFKAVDLHEGLDSTLVILENRLKPTTQRPAIAVVRHYSELPKVECYAGQLNQVFMNILVNAIDAIEESTEGKEPTLEIRTQKIGEAVEIVISDNGSGMTEEVRSKLFDPFFTTKPVGKGTGLGLSVSYQIVTQRHQGKLECYSTLGKGTEFIIKIPLKR